MKQANAVVDKGSTIVVDPTPGLGDATTIADAIAMLPAGGGKIFLREGTYPISATITMPDAPVVIKGCGDSTIISLGANVIAAFSIPNGLTARRNYVFEDFLVTGTSVAGQIVWTTAEANTRGLIYATRVNSVGVQITVNITAATFPAEPHEGHFTDCQFQPIANGSSILFNATANLNTTAFMFVHRLRFYATFQDAIAGTLTNGNPANSDFSGINIIGEDSVFAVATDCTPGAINLVNSSIYNFTGGPNPTIATAGDNTGSIQCSLVGCESQFVNYDLNGEGMQVADCVFFGVTFTDEADSTFSNCLSFQRSGLGGNFIGTGQGQITGCRANAVSGNWDTLAGNDIGTLTLTNSSATISGNKLNVVTLTGCHAAVSGNVISGAYTETGTPNALSGNKFTGAAPSLITTNQSNPNIYLDVPTKGTIFAQIATATIANSGAETTLLASGIGTTLLPANYLVPGRTIKIKVTGIISDTLVPNYTVNLRLNGTLVATATGTFTGVIANDVFEIIFVITCRTTGVGGTAFIQGSMETNAVNRLSIANTAPTVVDTTVSTSIDVLFQWGTADPANTISATNALIEAA